MAILRSQVKLLSYRSRRQQQASKNAGPLLIFGLAICLMLFLWMTGALLFTVSTTKIPKSFPLIKLQDGQVLPRDPVDLWPGSNTDGKFKIYYPSCFPHEDTTGACQVPVDRTTLTIQTTPTITGEAAASQLREYLRHSLDLEIHVQTLSSEVRGWIIHVAVVPPILEAMDLLLRTVQDNEPPPTLRDIDYTIKRVLQHHCEMTAVVPAHSAVWSLTLNEALAYPTTTRATLYEFLQMDHISNDVSISDASLSVLDRIHDISLWFERQPNQNWKEWTEHVIGGVHPRSNCQLVEAPPSGFPERVHAALEGTLRCDIYPSIDLCRSESVVL